MLQASKFYLLSFSLFITPQNAQKAENDFTNELVLGKFFVEPETNKSASVDFDSNQRFLDQCSFEKRGDTAVFDCVGSINVSMSLLDIQQLLLNEAFDRTAHTCCLKSLLKAESLTLRVMSEKRRKGSLLFEVPKSTKIQAQSMTAKGNNVDIEAGPSTKLQIDEHLEIQTRKHGAMSMDQLEIGGNLFLIRGDNASALNISPQKDKTANAYFYANSGIVRGKFNVFGVQPEHTDTAGHWESDGGVVNIVCEDGARWFKLRLDGKRPRDPNEPTSPEDEEIERIMSGGDDPKLNYRKDRRGKQKKGRPSNDGSARSN